MPSICVYIKWDTFVEKYHILCQLKCFSVNGKSAFWYDIVIHIHAFMPNMLLCLYSINSILLQKYTAIRYSEICNAICYSFWKIFQLVDSHTIRNAVDILCMRLHKIYEEHAKLMSIMKRVIVWWRSNGDAFYHNHIQLLYTTKTTNASTSSANWFLPNYTECRIYMSLVLGIFNLKAILFIDRSMHM